MTDGKKVKPIVSFKPFSGDYLAKKQYSGFQPSDEPVGSVICEHVWSPIVFEKGKRREKNFLISYVCALDFDGELSIEQAKKNFLDYRYIIAPTKSHRMDGEHRFRVVIPWQRPITSLKDYRHTMARLVRTLDADPQCVDGARFFWPSKEIYAVNAEGEDMEVLKAPDEPIYREPPRAVRKNIPDWLWRKIKEPTPKGQRHGRLYHLSARLWRCGYDAEEIEKLLKKEWQCEGTLEHWDFRRHVQRGAKAEKEKGAG